MTSGTAVPGRPDTGHPGRRAGRPGCRRV